MTHVVINFMGIKIKEYETEKPFQPDIIGFLKDMKKLEKETKGGASFITSTAAPCSLKNMLSLILRLIQMLLSLLLGWGSLLRSLCNSGHNDAGKHNCSDY